VIPVRNPALEQHGRPARNQDCQDYDSQSDKNTRNRNRDPAESELPRQVAPDLRDYRRRVLQQERYVPSLSAHLDKHSYLTVAKAL